MEKTFTSLFANLLSRVRPPRAPEAPASQLAGFGKHPCSGEHVPQQGMDAAFGLTGHLPEVRRRLYVEPFEPPSALSRGVVSYWTKQAPQSLIPMGHSFLWRMSDALVVGRLWQSHDKTGRGEFPFVLAAELTGIDAARALRITLPLCVRLEASLKKTNDRQVVQHLLDDARAELAAATKAIASEPTRTVRAALATLFDEPALGPGGDVLLRILFAIDHLDPGGSEGLISKLVRIPCAPIAPGDIRLISDNSPLLLWHDAIVQRFGEKAVLLALLPDGQPWIDVIIGRPHTDHLQCLRLKPPTIEMATSLPQPLDVSFRAKADQWLDSGGTRRFSKVVA